MINIIKYLFGNRQPPVSPHCPEGQRLYCIGDIHGRADLLKELHILIQNDAASYPGQKTIVYLGDYIDRGDASRTVIDLLLHSPLPDFKPVYLRGNHDQSLLDFLQYTESGPGWFNHGGLATLVSYGVKVAKIPTRKKDYIALQQDLTDKLPAQHLNFFNSSQLQYQSGSYFFVHAGIRPNIALDKQQSEDLLWIRDEFLEQQKTYEKIIVHGHTISDKAELHPNRIGIDTGAYISGTLTALVLEKTSQRILQT